MMQSKDPAAAARQLAEQGLRQQQEGAWDQAQQSLDQAQQLDPDAVAETLQATGADTAPDSRDAGTDQIATPPERRPA